MLLNEFNVFDMDLFMVNVSPDFPNGSNNNNDNNNNNKNCDNIGLTYNHNNLNTSSNFNGNCTNSTNTTTMDDGFMFDDKLIDFGQDLDTLSLSLWRSEGFNGINCEEPMKIEDIFQAGINDFTDGPTLAELNLVDDKLDSADLDEYLVNPPSMAADKDDVNGLENVKDTPTELKTNSLDGLAVFNNVNAPSSSVHLTSDEIEQLVTLAEPSNADPQDYDSVYANNQSQSSSASPCPSWEVKKDAQSSSLNEQQSLNSLPMPQKIFKQPEQRDVKPLTVDSKLSSSTNTDVLMNNNENVVNVSACPAMSIKQEPVSPEMDLDNLALSYNQNSCDVNEEKVTKNEQIQINHPGPSPEYSKPQLRRRRNNSNSTDCSFSSHDEGFASQPEDNSDNDQENDDSDDESFYNDYDAKDLLGATTSEDAENKWALDMGRTRKTGQQRYFWQYNVQSKGPKGTRLVQLQDICNDPHVLMEAKDPVFSPDCSMEGVKHAGKARRGDGNDLTPNPKKLLMIGLELKKLSKIINELTPVAQVPVNSRNKSRKEKNKLASRACRLKKKAQHEANKIKLYGLQQEHKRMMNALIDIQHLANVVLEKGRSVHDGRLTDIYENIVASKGPKVKVAGDTTEFVNSILDNVSAGISDGGLDQL